MDIVHDVNSVLDDAIERGVFPGAVAGWIDEQGIVTISPRGRFTYEVESEPVVSNTIYDVASVTKSIPVGTLGLLALQEGRCSLDTPLASIVPEYRSPWAHRVTMRHLFTHTLDFNFRLSSLKVLPPDELLATIMRSDLTAPPGEKFFYSNATSILLGCAIERLFGEPLDLLAQRKIFDPCNMTESFFSPAPSLSDRIPPTEVCDWRGGIVRAQVHDESAAVLSQIMVPGSAGLFSTAPDLLRFLKMLLDGGMVDGRAVIAADSIALMAKNQLASLGLFAGVGWELNQERFMGTKRSQRTIGKTGFTGCSVICDFEKNRCGVLLSNYTWPKRKAGAELINAVRSNFADILLRDG